MKTKGMITNRILAKMTWPFLAAVLTVAGCGEDELPPVSPEEPDEEMVDPWTPWHMDDEQEEKIVLEEIACNGWDSRVASYKDKTYDSFFTRDIGWNGGDGVYTTELPDGNIFWSFGDSFYGMLQDPDRRIRGGNEVNFPRNSLMIQTKENAKGFHFLNEMVQTTEKFKPGYFKARTFLRHPDGEMTEEQIADGQIDQEKLYWPGDATVYTENGKSVLQVLWGAVDKQMARDETALTEYDLSGKPGDESYMKQISYIRNLVPYTTNYGSSIYEGEDGHTYLYGSVSLAFGGTCPIVARTATHDLKSEWEYYIKGKEGSFQWQKQIPTQDEMNNSIITEGTQWASQPNVFKKNGCYYMVAQEAAFGKQVFIWRAETPYGPFKDRVQIFTLPETVDKLGEQKYNHAYNVFLHHGLSKEGELVISMNIDASSFDANFNSIGSADFYRPYFFRLYNWESVYDESR